MDPIYRSIEGLVEAIPGSIGMACELLLDDSRALFERTSGSTHNHQVWCGGYIDHVTEVMNIAVVLYRTFNPLRPLPFTLGDALLVLFLHDIEKPWRFEDDGQGGVRTRTDMVTKEQREAFRIAKLAEYGIQLTSEQANALKYVEGEYKDYRSDARVSNELAAFCHMCDTWSARGWHNYPLAEDDSWGHRRRTT